MKEFISILVLTSFISCTYNVNEKVLEIQEQQIIFLKKENDSLRNQIKRCENWIDIIEEY